MLPDIPAAEGAEYLDPTTGMVLYVSQNNGTEGDPDYQWRRNPEFSVIREFSEADQLRLATVEFNAAKALGKVQRGTVQQMLLSSADYFIVEDPDEQLNAIYGGGYVQRNGNMYKTEFYDKGITLEDVLEGYFAYQEGQYGTGNPGNTGGGTGGDGGGATGGSTDPIVVGNNGITVQGASIGLPDADLYQIQDSTTYAEKFQGRGPALIPVGIGKYNVINLTDSTRTDNVVVTVAIDDTGGGGTTPDTGSVSVGNYGVRISGNKVIFPDTDYYQIQDAVTYIQLYQGSGSSVPVTVPDGKYHIINLTDSTRTENITIPLGSYVAPDPDTTTPVTGAVAIGTQGVQIVGSTIVLPTSYYWQIQNSATFANVFEGTYKGTPISLAKGKYTIINLTQNIRHEAIDVPQVQAKSTDPVIGVVGSAAPAYSGSATLASIPASPGFTVAILSNTSCTFSWGAAPTYVDATDSYELVLDGFVIQRDDTRTRTVNGMSAGIHTATVRVVRDDGSFGLASTISFSVIGVATGTGTNTGAEVGTFGVRLYQNEFILPDTDYYQIQDSTTYVAAFQGFGAAGKRVPVPNGTYNVINMTDSVRIDSVVVTGTAPGG